MTHAEEKELIDKYHAAAIKMYKETNVHISQIKNVQICENGAYVEGMVWIPKESVLRF
jgi:hypothetical protein